MKLVSIIGLWALIGATAIGCSSAQPRTGFGTDFGDDNGNSSAPVAATQFGIQRWRRLQWNGPERFERRRGVRFERRRGVRFEQRRGV